MNSTNKRKIINDPVYGFIHIPDSFIFEIIEHPYFQRLRRIQQLGLTHYVYPGALHTRFHHALGAMHLMSQALENIRAKGTQITEEEFLNACLAVLLHDIGHGPFSHALENIFLHSVKHEKITDAIIEYYNNLFNNSLHKALLMFRGKYPRKFFNQLVSGQLDVDRLDYLTRDSFFTGVSEGIIGTERILKMMNVIRDTLVIEEKGIQSIEKFLISRQLMYWQVYYHKTVLSAEILLLNVINRVIELYRIGKKFFLIPSLEKLFSYYKHDYITADIIEIFCSIDDFDIIYCLKQWRYSSDPILSKLSTMILERKLFRTLIFDKNLSSDVIYDLQKIAHNKLNCSVEDIKYFLVYMPVKALVYDRSHNPITILYRDGRCCDILESSTILRLGFLSEEQVKFVLSFPKELTNDVMNLLIKQ